MLAEPCQDRGAQASADVEVQGLLNRDGLPPETSRRSRMLASRLTRLVAVTALVVVAGIAVGAASRPHSVELSLATPQLGEVAVLVVLVLAGAIGLLIGSNPSPIWVMDPNRAISVKAKGSRLPWGVRAVMTLLALMVVVFLVTSARTFSGDRSQPLNLPAAVPIAASNSTSVTGGGVYLVLASVVVAVTCGLVAAVLFREKTAEAVVATRGEAAVAILDEGLGAMLAEHDPRKAVIAAYVAMERAMARKGWPRRPHEAPTEHLARVLGVAPARARDLDQLVDTYEFARFSEHDVTPAMRDNAVDSVRRLRADLEETV